MVDEANRAVFRIHIQGPIEAVWRELTKTDTPQRAVFNGRMHVSGPGRGAAFQMRTASGRYTMVVGEVLEHEPPKRFAHSFRFTNYDDPECVVIYDLVPAGGGVDVTMTIERLPVGTKTEKEMRQGGPFILNNLKSQVERGRVPFGTAVMYALFGALEFVLPKRQRSENWPLERSASRDAA